MSTITLEVNIRQIETAIRHLKLQDKIKLIENLEKDAWPDRLKALLQRIDSKANKYPINEKTINQACEEVRHKRHAHRRN